MAKNKKIVRKKPKINKGIKSQLLSKEVRQKENIESSLSHNPVWQLSLIDSDGGWGWKKIGKDRWLNLVLPKLRDFEKMTWAEIEGSQSHFINTNSISKDAQKRLADLNLDDLDQVFSLRLQGKPRLIGKRIGYIFQIIWFDFDHEVCPSKKKYT